MTEERLREIEDSLLLHRHKDLLNDARELLAALSEAQAARDVALEETSLALGMVDVMSKELQEARDTNTSFHRRVQTIEGKERKKRTRLEREISSLGRSLAEKHCSYVALNEKYQRITMRCCEAQAANAGEFRRGVEAAANVVDAYDCEPGCGCWGSRNSEHIQQIKRGVLSLLLPADVPTEGEASKD